MDLNTITVQDFKEYFYRDFAYLPVWNITTTYNQGQRVYYETDSLFYDCLKNGVTSIPTTATDWSIVTKDDVNNYILDQDIEKSFKEAQFQLNQSLFCSDEEITIAYLYLTAFYLVRDINTSMAGLESTGQYPVASRSVGSVSESYDIPQAYKESPTL